MKVTVCEISDDEVELAEEWPQLVRHVQSEKSDLVLLPEMPFYPWFPSRPEPDAVIWQEAVAAHERWNQRLPELAPAVVLGSRPVDAAGLRLNEGFLWESGQDLQPVHAKYYLPDEAGFWEATWYDRGSGEFEPVRIRDVSIGFAICTEIWFMQRLRAYGKQGVHLIANPRATGRDTLEKWLVGGRAAAVVSGAYCISSNRVDRAGRGSQLGGQGWVIGPDAEVLGLTSQQDPFVTVTVDQTIADRAKSTYPRYVLD